MANKAKIRSMRFSDDVYEMIENQAGENFSQKFDALVTRCFYELPAKERELQRIEKQIFEKKRELEKLSTGFFGLSSTLRTAFHDASNISEILRGELEGLKDL